MQVKRTKARTADGKRVVVEYVPLTDPKKALEYADILRDGFNDVVVKTRGIRITVTARNSIK